MNAAAALIIEQLYPDSGVPYAREPPPINHPHTKIITDVNAGVWTPPAAANTDYLTNILPCLVIIPGANPEMTAAVLPFIEKARRLNPRGVVAIYLLALVNERKGKLFEARTLYDEAVAFSNAECYPAYVGIARILSASGKREEAISLLLDVTRLYPDNYAARRQLAYAYIAERDWARAEPVIASVLSHNYHNAEFLLLQARVFIELGRHTYAALPLDTYATLGAELNRTYQFLRARIAWEGNRSRTNALTVLRALLGAWPNDSEAQVYMTRLLLGSTNAANREEGRALLRLLLDAPDTDADLSILELSLDDAVERAEWNAASGYLERILAVDRSYETLQRAVTVHIGADNRGGAIAMAREAAARFPGDTANLLLIGTLTEYGTAAQRSEAGALISRMLAATQVHAARSRAMYYRSRLRTNDEDAIRDLSASRLEDPRNLDALLSLISIYDRRKDSRRVKFFLQQALVLAPENAELNRLKGVYED